jgi:hypothetical protein
MKRFVLLLLLARISWCALPNLTTWEVRTLGAATNGGGFVTGASGTDMSVFNNKNAAACTNCQSAVNNISTTDLVTAGTTTIVSATAAFTAASVGNIVYITGGTGAIAAARYEITVFTNSTTVTVDRSTGLTTGTGATLNIGGALNALTTLNTALGTTSNIQQTGWVKADATYAVTANQSLGPTCTAATNACSIQVNGYTTARGDNGKATIQSTSGSGYTLLSIDNNNNLQNLIVRNFVFDCNSLVNSTGFSINANGNSGQNLEAKNCGAYGISLNLSGGNGGMCLNCYSHNNPGSTSRSGGFQVGSQGVASSCIWCVAIANGATGNNLAVGFNLNGGSLCLHCISANNTGSTGAEKNEGFFVNNMTGNVILINSVSYGNSQDGLRIGVVSNYPFVVSNSIFVNNTGIGLNSPNTTYVANAQWENYNAFFGNTGGAIVGMTSGANDVTLTGDPFTNGAGNVFTLNNTAGAGKAAQGVAFPGALLAGGTGALDIGALQHTTAAGAGQSGSPIIQ